MNTDKKELTSALTHLGGAIFGIVGTFLLLNNAENSNNTMTVIAYLIFGLSMILLYSASTIYHFIDRSKAKAKLIMRKLDHIMIFVLIAGTYTPICLLVLDKTAGYRLLTLVWSITFIGTFIKLFWIKAPNWVSSVLYIAMGWLAVLVLPPLVNTMPAGGLLWLITGGISYTVGGVIYGIKKPNINNTYFGFHELFHLFVLAGTFCHFIMIYFYIG
ncbi:MAG: hemolysin III family protein [Sedimentibacter sp.]